MKAYILLGVLWMGVSIAVSNIQAQQIEIPGSKKMSAASAAAKEVKVLSLTDTPARTFPRGFAIQCSSRKCYRRAKSFAKKKEYENSLAHAVKGLLNDPKPRVARKLRSFVNQKAYDAAYKAFLSETKILEKNTQHYEEPASAKQAAYLFWHTYRFYMINQWISRIEDHQIVVQTIPSERLGFLTEKEHGYRKRAASEYLENGKILAESADILNQKSAFHYFEISDQYSPSEEAKRLRDEARIKATTSLFIAPATYRRNYSGLATALDEQIGAFIMNDHRFPALTFFNLVSTKGKSEYILKSVISEWEVLPKPTVTEKKTFTSRVDTGKKDDKGNAIMKEVSNKITLYSKKTEASTTITWQIVNRKDGTIVASGKNYGYHGFLTSWATGTDSDAIPRKYRELIGRKQEKAPSRNVMIERAISDTAAKIALDAMKHFIIRQGKRLDH